MRTATQTKRDVSIDELREREIERERERERDVSIDELREREREGRERE